MEIHQAAVLRSPPMDLRSQAQSMHADNLGFISLVCIIILSNDGADSTYIIPGQYHGLESKISRDQYLNFTWRKKGSFPEVQSAVKKRYGQLLELEPQELFQMCEPKRLQCGEIEIFRSDLLHAGPMANLTREVLFVEIRVKGERGPVGKDYQFKIVDLMTISNYEQAAIDEVSKKWEMN